MHSETGAAVQELRPDHTFEMRITDLVPEQRTYFDVRLDGTFSYSAGVITYRLTRANLPRRDDYIRDFVAKRDKACLWIVDPFHDTLTCEKAATTLDPPPPPAGYKKGTNPDYTNGDAR